MASKNMDYKLLNMPNGNGIVMSKRQIRFLIVVGGVLLFGAVLTALNVYELHRLTTEHFKDHEKVPVPEGKGEAEYSKPIAWIRGPHKSTGYLKHVHNVFSRLGYELIDPSDEDNVEWDVLWSHNYPFKELKTKLRKLKPHQKVNHIPGSGFISNKVNLATSGLDFIPKAFKIPSEKEKLLKYSKENPDTMFVQKSNNHRGIKIEKIDALDLEMEGSFIQEFIHNPLLIDGHKFDIGIYTVITSVNPLRVYLYEGDVLFRFCTEKYHPFDSSVSAKYVVGDDYLPTWKVPSLKPYYEDQGFGMKNSFDSWMIAMNMDPEMVWNGVRDAIRQVMYKKEQLMKNALNTYAQSENFFEMMRFDFIIDDKLKVHLMEANMSPNLSSAHFKENRLLYEQVLYNILSLVGVGRAIHSNSLAIKSKEEYDMAVADKDIYVYPEHCKANCRENKLCSKPECQLCKNCLGKDVIKKLKSAYLEHMNRENCRRIIPVQITPDKAHDPVDMDDLTAENTLMTEWFRGKCILDLAFCI